MSEDFYDILGVSQNASEDEIKRAFRKKAAQYHPDVSDEPDAEEKFKRVQKAKEVLSDDEKRELYDRLGHDQYLQFEKQGGVDADTAGRARQHAGGFGGADPFGDIFEQFFGGDRGGGRSRPSKGRDLKTTMRIDLEDAYHGVTKRVTVRRPETCGTCDGTGYPPDATARTCPQCGGQGRVTQVQRSPFGQVQRTQPCPQCDGEGELYSEECSDCRGRGQIQQEAQLEVDVPAGIRDGQTLRMEGEGAAGERGAPPGDLLIEISVAPHPDFERDGDHLRYELGLSFPQAALGDTVRVPTIDGEVEVTIPAGTQNGDVFRVSGKGMPQLRGRGHGDLLVEVQVVVPESLTDEQKAAIEALAEASDEDLDVDSSLFDRIKGSF